MTSTWSLLTTQESENALGQEENSSQPRSSITGRPRPSQILGGTAALHHLPYLKGPTCTLGARQPLSSRRRRPGPNPAARRASLGWGRARTRISAGEERSPRHHGLVSRGSQTRKAHPALGGASVETLTAPGKGRSKQNTKRSSGSRGGQSDSRAQATSGPCARGPDRPRPPRTAQPRPKPHPPQVPSTPLPALGRASAAPAGVRAPVALTPILQRSP